MILLNVYYPLNTTRQVKIREKWYSELALNSTLDENIIPIFLTFFRKFMKPYELVKILVERFENDGLSMDTTPTTLQKRFV